uniref:Uncharacterized protein n=1 Tax=Meloidogyne floridensis TaxID=298350 RepID=A0A915P7L7_9BILA
MSAQQFSSSSPSPSPTFFTSTSLPILCLIDWHSPECQEQHYQIPAPKFASAQFLPLSESSENDNDYLNNENGFFTPIISKSLNREAQGSTSTITTTYSTSLPTFQTSPQTKPTSVYSTKLSSSPSTSTISSTTTTRKRPHSWTRPRTKLEHFTFASIPSASPIQPKSSKLLSSELNLMNSDNYNVQSTSKSNEYYGPSSSEILNDREEKLLKTLGHHNRHRIKLKQKEEKGREIEDDEEESQKMEEEKEDEESNVKQNYIPKGGWPMRTRTWPDGRRLGSDGLKKWQKLRPKITQQEDKIKEKAKQTETTKTSKSSPSSPSTAPTKITLKTTEMPLQRFTVDPGIRPGLHFTFGNQI